MLTHVTIKNFRCLRDVSVPLKPLTVLVGPNDSGKSAFLLSLKTMAGNRSIERPFDFWRLDVTQEISLTAKPSGSPFSFTSRNPDITPARDHTEPSAYFVLPAAGIATECSGVADQVQHPQLQDTGENTASLYDYLYRLDHERFDAIEAAARNLIPGLQKIQVAQPHADRRRLDLIIEGGLKLRGEHVSVGLRLLLFFLVLSYHPTPPKTIVIEEPENGLHPKRLSDVMRLLREITEGKHGNNTAQVILTTHSPYLLDHVNLETDQVLVFRRNDDGSRTAEPADAERLKTFLDEFVLGEVWYNVGEEGLVARKS